MSLLFNTLSRFVIPFHPRNKACLVDAVLCLVTLLCPTLCDPMDCSLPGSSVYGDSPGKKTWVGWHFLLQGIFPTQGSNPGLLYCRWILCHLSHQGSLYTTEEEIQIRREIWILGWIHHGRPAHSYQKCPEDTFFMTTASNKFVTGALKSLKSTKVFSGGQIIVGAAATELETYMQWR